MKLRIYVIKVFGIMMTTPFFGYFTNKGEGVGYS